YTLFKHHRGEKLTEAERQQRQQQFLNQLRIPGIYEVGGLGACTLIRRSALEKGVNFSEIPNLSFWGEDRHFCIRAAALGLRLWVDTHVPAYHIYRLDDLDGVTLYRENCHV
ncbi:MAG: glycosyl transferase, partial [Alicyclobacillus sp.]|nr:glycosyl transferase [Alicyclobacillus sp.]